VHKWARGACAASSAVAADLSASAEAALVAGESEARRQWARLDDVMKAIADPNSLEGCIAKRAQERLTHLTKDLQLDSTVMELASQVLPVAHNVAKASATTTQQYLRAPVQIDVNTSL
jgi:uncharacterized protein with PIN domain